MPTDLERFGAVIQEARKRQELTQDVLAEKTGFHSVYISALERGTKNPTLRTILKIAEALDIPPWALIYQAFAPDSTATDLQRDLDENEEGLRKKLEQLQRANTELQETLQQTLSFLIEEKAGRRPGTPLAKKTAPSGKK